MQENTDDEKTFKDAHKYCRQAQARLQAQDGDKGRQKSFKAQAPKR